MSKFTDTIRAALEKKHAAAHPDTKSDAKEDGKSKTKRSPAVITGKPVKKVTGRGR
jgi:hypothetical protein